MSKISNAIAMLNLLSNGKKYSIEELAGILEVTPRMIRTYKQELEKAGIYIDSIMGPYGGYVLSQSIILPTIKFKKEDYELLDKFINSCSSKIDKENLATLKDKIKSVSIERQIAKEELDLKDEILNKYNILNRAIKERRKIKILYFSYNKGENERIIEPAEMFLFKDGWYCAAYCELRGDIRQFELKRIKKIELMEENF